jgi:hypothetical protein
VRLFDGELLGSVDELATGFVDAHHGVRVEPIAL